MGEDTLHYTSTSIAGGISNKDFRSRISGGMRGSAISSVHPLPMYLYFCHRATRYTHGDSHALARRTAFHCLTALYCGKLRPDGCWERIALRSSILIRTMFGRSIKRFCYNTRPSFMLGIDRRLYLCEQWDIPPVWECKSEQHKYVL